MAFKEYLSWSWSCDRCWDYKEGKTVSVLKEIKVQKAKQTCKSNKTTRSSSIFGGVYQVRWETRKCSINASLKIKEDFIEDVASEPKPGEC